MDVAVAYRLHHGTLHPGSTSSASDFQHEKSIPQYFGLLSLGSCTALHYRTPFNRSNEVWVTPLQPHGSEMARPCFFHAPVKRQGGLSRYLQTTYGFLPARWSLSFCPPRDGGLYSSLTPSILSSTKLILATTVGTALDVGKWHSGCPGCNRPRGCRGSWRTLVLSHNGNTTAWNEGSSDQHFDCSWELPIKFTDPNTRSPRLLV